MRASAAFLVSLFILTGCNNKYYSSNDFRSVMKIDAHVHIESDNGIFEAQAADDNFKLLTIEVDHSDSASLAQQHFFMSRSAGIHPGKVFYSASFCFDTAGWGTADWSRKIISRLNDEISGGAVSVKLWKNIGMTVRDHKGRFIMADDPLLQPVVNFIKGRHLPITAHLGEPRNCWLPLDQMTVRGDSSYFAGHQEYHMFLHPDFPSYEDQINARDNLLKKNPDLVFIGCHLGSLEWNVDSLARRLDEFPNMAVDLAARICHLQYQSARDRAKIRDFCIKYQDRLLYGTDTGYSGGDPENFRNRVHKIWLDDWNYFATDMPMESKSFRGCFKGLNLPSPVVRKIFGENAARWYKIS
jgi:hypothetical protein